MEVCSILRLAAPIVGIGFAAWDLNLLPKAVNEVVKNTIGLVPAPQVVETFVVPPELHTRTIALAAIFGTLFTIHVIAQKVFNSSENPDSGPILPR